MILSTTSCILEVKKQKQTLIAPEFELDVTYKAIVKNVIIGDFNGDGKIDELKENLVSKINNKSIDALPDLDYDSLLVLIHEMKPVLSLISTAKNIPNLILTKEVSFGIFSVKNEGDLNQDGTDEISVVIDWADNSMCNTCSVYSLQKNKWIEFAKFDVREWQVSQNSNFSGFITKNANDDFVVETFDSELNEIQKPFKEVLVKHF